MHESGSGPKRLSRPYAFRRASPSSAYRTWALLTAFHDSDLADGESLPWDGRGERQARETHQGSRQAHHDGGFVGGNYKFRSPLPEIFPLPGGGWREGGPLL